MALTGLKIFLQIRPNPTPIAASSPHSSAVLCIGGEPVDSDIYATLDGNKLKHEAKKHIQKLGAYLTLSEHGADIVVFHHGSFAMLENLAEIGKPVVSPDWLAECSAKGMRVPTKPYEVQLIQDLTADASLSQASVSPTSSKPKLDAQKMLSASAYSAVRASQEETALFMGGTAGRRPPPLPVTPPKDRFSNVLLAIANEDDDTSDDAGNDRRKRKQQTKTSQVDTVQPQVVAPVATASKRRATAATSAPKAVLPTSKIVTNLLAPLSPLIYELPSSGTLPSTDTSPPQAANFAPPQLRPPHTKVVDRFNERQLDSNDEGSMSIGMAPASFLPAPEMASGTSMLLGVTAATTLGNSSPTFPTPHSIDNASHPLTGAPSLSPSSRPFLGGHDDSQPEALELGQWRQPNPTDSRTLSLLSDGTLCELNPPVLGGWRIGSVAPTQAIGSIRMPNSKGTGKSLDELSLPSAASTVVLGNAAKSSSSSSKSRLATARNNNNTTVVSAAKSLNTLTPTARLIQTIQVASAAIFEAKTAHLRASGNEMLRSELAAFAEAAANLFTESQPSQKNRDPLVLSMTDRAVPMPNTSPKLFPEVEAIPLASQLMLGASQPGGQDSMMADHNEVSSQMIMTKFPSLSSLFSQPSLLDATHEVLPTTESFVSGLSGHGSNNASQRAATQHLETPLCSAVDLPQQLSQATSLVDAISQQYFSQHQPQESPSTREIVGPLPTQHLFGLGGASGDMLLTKQLLSLGAMTQRATPTQPSPSGKRRLVSKNSIFEDAAALGGVVTQRLAVASDEASTPSPKRRVTISDEPPLTVMPTQAIGTPMRPLFAASDTESELGQKRSRTSTDENQASSDSGSESGSDWGSDDDEIKEVYAMLDGPLTHSDVNGGPAGTPQPQTQPQRFANPQPKVISVSGTDETRDVLTDVFITKGVQFESKVFGRSSKPSHVLLLGAAQVTPKVLFALASATPLVTSDWGFGGVEMGKFPALVSVEAAARGQAGSDRGEPFVPPVTEVANYNHSYQRPLRELYAAGFGHNASIRKVFQSYGIAIGDAIAQPFTYIPPKFTFSTNVELQVTSTASSPCSALIMNTNDEVLSPLELTVKFLSIAHRNFGQLSRKVLKVMKRAEERAAEEAEEAARKSKRRRAEFGKGKGKAAVVEERPRSSPEKVVNAKRVAESRSPIDCLATSTSLSERLYKHLRQSYLGSILVGMRFYILGNAATPFSNTQLVELINYLGGTVVRAMNANPLTVVLEADEGTELAKMAKKRATGAPSPKQQPTTNKASRVPLTPTEREVFLESFPHCDFLVSYRWLVNVIVAQQLIDFTDPAYMITARYADENSRPLLRPILSHSSTPNDGTPSPRGSKKVSAKVRTPIVVARDAAPQTLESANEDQPNVPVELEDDFTHVRELDMSDIPAPLQNETDDTPFILAAAKPEGVAAASVMDLEEEGDNAASEDEDSSDSESDASSASEDSSASSSEESEQDDLVSPQTTLRSSAVATPASAATTATSVNSSERKTHSGPPTAIKAPHMQLTTQQLLLDDEASSSSLVSNSEHQVPTAHRNSDEDDCVLASASNVSDSEGTAGAVSPSAEGRRAANVSLYTSFASP